jgi:hypothetical protein
MILDKIQNIKISLMEIVDEVNMDPTKLDCIIRTSVFINLENLDFIRSENTIKEILSDMYSSLAPYRNNPEINYIGIWIKYDDEIFDNSIKIQTLDDIKNYSSEEVNGIYEFLIMTLPE